MLRFRLATYLESLQYRLKSALSGQRPKRLSRQTTPQSCFVEILETRQVLSAPDALSASLGTITSTTADLNGSVGVDGGASITERGFVYSLSSANTSPQIGGTGVIQVAAGGTGTGSFSVGLTGLNVLADYSVASYAINGDGVSYSAVTSFKTLNNPGLIVTTTADVIDPADNVVSLREALALADSTPEPDTITFGGAVFSDAVPDTITLQSGPLNVITSVTIQGPGASLLTIDGDQKSRIFAVNSELSYIPKTTISGMTITGGSGVNGGAISIIDRDFTLVDSVVTGNAAIGKGGGIWGDGFRMTFTMLRTSVTNNTAGSDGGGIYIEDTRGILTIEDSTISGNTAGDDGGGIYLYDPDHDIIIRGTTISGNTAANKGGGIYFYNIDGGYPFTLENSTVSGNRARLGGGVYMFTPYPALILNSTIADNTATEMGGGLFIFDAGDSFVIRNTILAGNTVNGVTGSDLTVTSGTFQAVTNSLIQAMADGALVATTTSGNILNEDPLLLPLADNGGRTKTHALKPNSPALNKAAVDAQITTDQRGIARSSEPDIGAYELNVPLLTFPGVLNYSENDAPTPINSGLLLFADISLTLSSATVTITNVVPGEDVLGFVNDNLTMGNITIASNAGGVLTLTSAGGTATSAEWNAALQAVTYENTSDTPTTTTRVIDFQVYSDPFNSNVLSNEVNITAINDAPVAQASSVTTDEDTPYTFTLSDFQFTDFEDDSLVSIQISGLNLATGDTLTVDQGAGAVAVTDGMTITAAQLASLIYTPAADENGAARSTFDFSVNDADSGTQTATMTINVTSVNDAPVFVSPDAFSISENGTAVGQVEVNDIDLPAQTITYSISGGVDAALFTIDPDTGALSFLVAPDYEQPADQGGDNVYLVQVSASDGSATVSQDLSINVLDIHEDPQISLNPNTGVYHLGKDRAFVDPIATYVADPKDVDYSNAILRASISSNRQSRDALSIRAGGKIEVKGRNIYFRGILIGTAERITAKQPDLVIHLTSSVNQGILQELIRKINFTTRNSVLPQPTRTLSVKVTNVSGRDSNLATRLIDVVAARK